MLRPGRIDTHIYIGLPDLKERRETLLHGLGFECGADVPIEVVKTIDAITTSKKAASMTFADFIGVANEVMISETNALNEVKIHNAVTLAEKLFELFQLFRPSIGKEELENFENVYREFRMKESKGAAASESNSQKLMLK